MNAPGHAHPPTTAPTSNIAIPAEEDAVVQSQVASTTSRMAKGATTTRRSHRLAGGGREGLQAIPTKYPRSKARTAKSSLRNHSRTILDGSAVPHEVADSASTPSATPTPVPSHPYTIDAGSRDKDKETMELDVGSKFDRIKRNPRNATKRSPSCAPGPQRNPDNRRKSPPMTASSMANAQVASNVLFMVGPPTAMDSTQTSHPITEPAVPPTQTQDLPAPSSNSTETVASTTSDRTLAELATPSRDITDQETSITVKKRSLEPECHSLPPAKQARQLPEQVEKPVVDTTANEVRPSIEVAQPYRAPRDVDSSEVPKLDQVTASGDSDEDGQTPEVARGLSESSNRADQDLDFMHKMRESLLVQSKRKTVDVAKRQATRILKLLRSARPPDDGEALFVSGQQAREHLQANKYFPGPIFTDGEQPLPLQTIAEYLDEQYDDSATVFVQDPSIRKAKQEPFTREITVGKVKEFFQKDKPGVAYNCLELAAHVEDGTRPAFLNVEDCRLLTKVKIPSSKEKMGRRGYEPGWKEVEKWALLAKAGALTEPHQDSHGYNTYITVNQGTVGFGWLSNPSDEQRAAWRKDPAGFNKGPWRYVVLRRGQTVYFPAGTVHFVFRHPKEGDTLAFGGHVLRCSQIVRWVKTLLEERETESEVTNEDLSVSAPGYLSRVEAFVLQAMVKGTEEKWGGREAIEEFLKLKAQFLASDNPGRS